MIKEIICVICPKGCVIRVTEDGGDIKAEGFGCKRGPEYAIGEFRNPERLLTTSVILAGSDRKMLPVRSSGRLPKDRIPACIAELKKLRVDAPVNIHQVIIGDILGSGIDIISGMRAERTDGNG